MTIWKRPVSVELLTTASLNTAVSHLGIEFLEVGDDFLSARVPVDPRTLQPYGLLHGGVSVVLAETLGSCGAVFASPAGWRAVGLDINANHLAASPVAGSSVLHAPCTLGAPPRFGRLICATKPVK